MKDKSNKILSRRQYKNWKMVSKIASNGYIWADATKNGNLIYSDYRNDEESAFEILTGLIDDKERNKI